MKKRDFETVRVGDGFNEWLKNNHYVEKSIGFKITENWNEIVGNTIYHHTTRIDVRIPKIYLKIDNSSLKELLYADRQLLIDKINEYIHQALVTEIIFT